MTQNDQAGDSKLTQIYVEPTSLCNLNCRICVQKTWNEPTGLMGMDIFQNLMDGLRRQACSPKRVSFWGIGEPLIHPQIVNMVRQAKQLGAETLVITNGLLLNQEKAEGFIQAGLDYLILSIDSTSSESKPDTRCGDELRRVIQNINLFRTINEGDITRPALICGSSGQYEDRPKQKTKIGISFVLTKSNLHELSQLRPLAFSLGASLIMLTNLLPYSADVQDEILYSFSAGRSYPIEHSIYYPEISFPRLDVSPELFNVLPTLLGYTSSYGGSEPPSAKKDGYCRFVEEGSIAVNWQGEVSPCIPLMHSYTCYILGRKKFFRKCILGNLKTESLQDIWQSAEFARIRDTVKRFPFAPCTDCGGCTLAETNEEDCLNNSFPVCGDCLWAKGVIQCP